MLVSVYGYIEDRAASFKEHHTKMLFSLSPKHGHWLMYTCPESTVHKDQQVFVEDKHTGMEGADQEGLQSVHSGESEVYSLL